MILLNIIYKNVNNQINYIYFINIFLYIKNKIKYCI